MKKKFIILLVIGILLFVGPFCFNTYSLFRIVGLAGGIFLITLSLVFAPRRNVFLIMLTPIILLCLSYALDTFLFYKFSRIPLYVIEEKSNDKVSTYNSFFYRIYNCDGNLTLDYGYNKSYVCADEALDTININDFLIDPVKTYDEYKDKFVKITGKVSKLSGEESISLSAYTVGTDSLNGYVNFNTNYNLEVAINESLSQYRIYDIITVIGRVSSITDKDGVYTIKLSDAKLLPSDIYDSYTYEIVRSDSKDLVSMVKGQEYYLYGLSALNVKYANEAIYELSYLITDSRITLDDIVENTSATNMYDEEEVLVAKSYELEKFNVLVCENDKTIFANKDYKLGIDLCN